MLTRLARLGPTVPRLLSNSSVRFVSQSKPTGAAGSTAVTELHPAESAGGHSEVSQYVKVSCCARQASDTHRLTRFETQPDVDNPAVNPNNEPNLSWIDWTVGSYDESVAQSSPLAS